MVEAVGVSPQWSESGEGLAHPPPPSGVSSEGLLCSYSKDWFNKGGSHSLGCAGKEGSKGLALAGTRYPPPQHQHLDRHTSGLHTNEAGPWQLSQGQGDSRLLNHSLLPHPPAPHPAWEFWATCRFHLPHLVDCTRSCAGLGWAGRTEVYQKIWSLRVLGAGALE